MIIFSSKLELEEFMHPRPSGTSGAPRHPRLLHLGAAFARAHAQGEAARESDDKQGAQAPAVPAASAA